MLSVRDPFSLRQVDDRLCERGLDIGHETVRYWWNRFGPVLPRRSGNAVVIIGPSRGGVGLLMRCVSGSTGRPMIYGALWITTAKG